MPPWEKYSQPTLKPWEKRRPERKPDIIAEPEKSLEWKDVPGKAASNFVPSGINVLSSIANAVRHPLDTGKSILDVAAGGLQNVLPESVNQAIASIDPGAENAKMARDKADAVGKFYSGRYGSEEGFKQALANDPAGVLMDASAALSLGGSAASRVPGLASAGEKVAAAGSAIDPVLVSARAVKKGAELAGKTAAHAIGGLGTHTGGESLLAAFRAGAAGGEKAADFADNMRGNVSAADILPELRGALDNMRANRGAAYRAGMAEIGQDMTPLSMENIQNAIDSALNVKRYKGESLSPTTQGVQGDILSQFERWKELDPSQYHTAEGLDAFKQVIGDIRQNTPPNTPQRAVADQVYRSVRGEIINQVPEYANVMSDYEKASDLVNEIERSFSLGEKALDDTAIRKLQSLTRNNVSTNYGNRVSLAKELEQAGGKDFIDSIQGQALSSWTPRGLGKLVAGGTAGAGVYAHSPAAIPLLAAQSPRLMGEAALGLGLLKGYGARGADKIGSALSDYGIDPVLIPQFSYQSQQPKATR